MTNVVIGSVVFNPGTGEKDMTYDVARKVGEAEAWDRLADALERGDIVAARSANILLRKIHNVR